MSSLRDKQKNHIRAAREWLGEAETSLESENDVQSDLKLMLARAELSRVKDTPATSRLKARALKIMPAVCAALIVAAGAWVLGGPEEAARETSAVTQAVTDATAPARAAVTPETVDASATVAATESAPVPEMRTDGAAVTHSMESASAVPAPDSAPAVPVVSVPSSELATSASVGTQASTAVATATDTASAVSAPPPAEMQQLMQSAGKILRQ